MRRALIIGVTGQDGAYLAKHLCSEGYAVVGTTRCLATARLSGLRRVGVEPEVAMLELDPLDAAAVQRAFADVAPDEVYNLGGQSSVGASFTSPLDTVRSLVIGTLNLLEALRTVRPKARLFSAGSSEAFGDTEEPANESTPLAPKSPYACGKASATQLLAVYRRAYGLFACSGLTFNHESPLRPARYFTQKVALAAARMAKGSREVLTLGQVSAARDFGWAPEYVPAFHRMLQMADPTDLVLATGIATSLRALVDAALGEVGVRTEDRVVFDSSLERPADIRVSVGRPARAAALIGWQPHIIGEGVIVEMVRAALRSEDS